MSQITDTISNALKNVGNTVQDAGNAAANTADDTYKKISGNSSSSSKLTHNSGFSSDAKQLAGDVERMKDNAMRDGTSSRPSRVLKSLLTRRNSGQEAWLKLYWNNCMCTLKTNDLV